MSQHYHELNERLTKNMQSHIEKTVQSLEISDSSIEEDSFVIQSNIRGFLEAAEEYLHMTKQLKLNLIIKNSSNSFYGKYQEQVARSREEIQELLKRSLKNP